MTREEAKEYIIKHCNLNWDTGTRWNNAMECAVKALEQPERKHGKWVKEYWNGEHTRKCSACNITQTVTTYMGKVNFNYCPYCGAKMENDDD